MSSFCRTTVISVLLAPATIILVAGAGALHSALLGALGAGILLLAMRRFDEHWKRADAPASPPSERHPEADAAGP